MKFIRPLFENKNSLILYRGEEKDFLHPLDSDYSFFSKDISFAKDFGDYDMFIDKFRLYLCRS